MTVESSTASPSTPVSMTTIATESIVSAKDSAVDNRIEALLLTTLDKYKLVWEKLEEANEMIRSRESVASQTPSSKRSTETWRDWLIMTLPELLIDYGESVATKHIATIVPAFIAKKLTAAIQGQFKSDSKKEAGTHYESTAAKTQVLIEAVELLLKAASATDVLRHVSHLKFVREIRNAQMRSLQSRITTVKEKIKTLSLSHEKGLTAELQQMNKSLAIVESNLQPQQESESKLESQCDIESFEKQVLEVESGLFAWETREKNRKFQELSQQIDTLRNENLLLKQTFDDTIKDLQATTKELIEQNDSGTCSGCILM